MNPKAFQSNQVFFGSFFVWNWQYASFPMQDLFSRLYSMNGIIELRQTDENAWKAKYQGNYGVYTIKITLSGSKTVKFRCSCPSSGYPCKHIPIVEKAIVEKIAGSKMTDKNDALRLEDYIQNASAENLRHFILTQTKYNPELFNAAIQEFSVNAVNTKENKYLKIIQKSLSSVSASACEEDYYEDHYYDDENQDIDILDGWFDKARDYVRLKQYDEAILICKACIEEFSQWLHNCKNSYMFSSEYQSEPFGIMKKALEHSNKKELFDWCLSEMKKKKYAETYFRERFHDLLGTLAVSVDPGAFIALQDKLLSRINDKSSYEAEKLFKRKIDFYRQLGQPDKAWAIIESNTQIENFCYEAAKEKTVQGDFASAKKYIHDFMEMQKDGKSARPGSMWYNLFLEIAQKEKDIPVIRELSYGFIKNVFNYEYYKIYKTAFSSAEWKSAGRELFHHYSKGSHFSHSAADFLEAEEDSESLINYVEKYLSVDELEKYYKTFAPSYPEKTLELFKKAIVSYTEKNTGRSHYEKISSMLTNMSSIKGGKAAASQLAADFKARYKGRRLMLEMLGQF